ncbi:MAG: RHS repeat-associated core domain-containing protein, partial [Myxococcota bacterium]
TSGATDAQSQAVKSVTGSGWTRTLAYDSDGFLTSDRYSGVGSPANYVERTVEADALGCLTRVSTYDGALASGGQLLHDVQNVCSPTGERIYRDHYDAVAGTQSRVIYVGDLLELRIDEDEAVLRLPIDANTVREEVVTLSTGARDDTQSGYVHTDMRGSVLARTSLLSASTLNVLAEAEYGAWGDTLARAGLEVPRYQYTGVEPDPTGVYVFGKRGYDPTLRRWVSPDPLFLGAPASERADGRELNLFSYALNNPVHFVDPSGQQHSVGDVLQDLADSAYESGNRGTATAINAANALWQTVGFEGVSTLSDKVAGGEDVGTSDVVVAAVEVLPVGKVLKPLGKLAKNAAGSLAKTGVEEGTEAGIKKASKAGKSAPKVGAKGGPGAGKRFPDKVKDAAEQQSGKKCVFCGKETTRAKGPTQRNTDHAIPKSRGGNNTLDNAQNTCRTCNLKKGAKTTEEFLEGQ